MVVLLEVTPNAGCTSYTMAVSGLICGTPTPTVTGTPPTNTPTRTPTLTRTPTATPTCGGPVSWQSAAPVPTGIARYAFAQNGNDFMKGKPSQEATPGWGAAARG